MVFRGQIFLGELRVMLAVRDLLRTPASANKTQILLAISI
jgi:hypothetical protein